MSEIKLAENIVYDGNDTRGVLDALLGELRSKIASSGPTPEEENIVKRASNVASQDQEALIQEAVTELQGALQKYALPYSYFGTHPDEPSLIGYWPDWPSILDLPNYRSVEEALQDEEPNGLGFFTITNPDGSTSLYDLMGQQIARYT